MSYKRLIVALDTNDFSRVKQIVGHLDSRQCMVKVGLELFISQREKVLEYLSSQGFEIFLDLKLHDIPNTVSKAIQEIQNFNVSMTTIHLQGGLEMINAACESAQSTKILGVSLLTSLADEDTEKLYGNTFDAQFKKLINIANNSVVDGVVCSPHELSLLTNLNKIKVVPGIRNDFTQDDQKRVMSSAEAYSLGADFIVVGRPITQGDNVSERFKEYLC